MKNFLKIILVLSLILSLFGCAQAEGTDEEKLTAILNNISEDKDITRVDAVKYAGQIAGFLKTSELTTEETLAIVKPWITAQAPEVKARLEQQLEDLGDFLETQSDKLQAGLADGSIQEKTKEIFSAIASSGGIA